MILRLLHILLLGSLVSLSAQAVEFSADAYQQAPQSPPMKARMYVADKQVRKEYTANGQPVIEIFDAARQHAFLLMPNQHTYLERKASTADFTGKGEQNRNPCQGIEGARCKKLGQEKINGHSADKWEMTITQQGKDMRALYWIDTDRHMLVKQILPDGTTTELRLLGNERVNGRQTEKWEMTASNPQGQSMHSMQWYDPQLKISIREEMPGGYVRELKNISVGNQPADLFKVPAGYTLIKRPPATGKEPPVENGRR